MTDQRYRVMITDEVDPEGIALLRTHPAIEVIETPTLPAAELLQVIGEYDALIGRSATRISRELLDAGVRLKVIGRAGVGVDNVDLDRATELGIAVINAPGGNVVSLIKPHYEAEPSMLKKGVLPSETVDEVVELVRRQEVGHHDEPVAAAPLDQARCDDARRGVGAR